MRLFWTAVRGLLVLASVAPQPGSATRDLRECKFDCDRDSDCKGHLLCADEHKDELRHAGCDERKAYCGRVGGRRDEVCYDPDKLDQCRGSPPREDLGECKFDCDRDSDCEGHLLCADEHKDELRHAGCDERKAYCGRVGGRRDEVCYDPDKLDQCRGSPPREDLGECNFDCDRDSDCEGHLLCADEHKDELRRAGCDERKAYCGRVGGRRDEVCYDPSKLDQCH